MRSSARQEKDEPMDEQLLTGDWCDGETAKRKLGIAQRTLATWASKGILKFKTVQNGSHRFRLYDTASVDKLQREGRPADKPVVSDEVIDVRRKQIVRKPAQEAQCEMQKTQLETLMAQAAKNLETVVTLILTAQKAESDANRERLKAEREDLRERWEMDRQERMERRQMRHQPQSLQNGKARKAHA
jgi:hypothetical protein